MLPTVDVSNKKDEFNDCDTFRWIHTCLRLPPYVLLQTATIVAMFITIIYSLTVLFMPFYTDYISGCVDNTSSGTFIATRLNSIAYNYAASDGNSDKVRQVNKYNSVASSQCTTYSTSSQTDYQATISAYTALNATYHNSVYENKQLSTCIDLDTFDDYYDNACNATSTTTPSTVYTVCPIDSFTNTQYVSPSHYLNQQYCTDDDYTSFASHTFEDANFNCSTVHQCDTAVCGGPNEVIIEKVTRTCACTAQWYTVAHTIYIASAVAVYILLNTSRILFIKGIMMVFWKGLAPKVFEYKASCTADGALIPIQSNIPNSNCIDSRAASKHSDRSSTSIVGKESSYARKDTAIASVDDDDAHDIENDRKTIAAHDNNRRMPNISQIYRSRNDSSYFNTYSNTRSSSSTSSTKAIVREALNLELGKYVVKGYIYVIAGMALNLLWIIPLSTISSDLAYRG